MIRRAAKRDESERAIVQALEAVGATVQRLSADGVPDLLVGWRGRMWLLEVKLPLTARGAVQPGRHRKHSGGSGDMTAAQVAWWAWWKGPPPVVVRTPEEALAAIGAVVTRAPDLSVAHADTCACRGSGWLWGSELLSPESTPTDTRYPCDRGIR